MKGFGTICFASLLVLVFASISSGTTLVVNCGTVSGPTELTAAAILCPQFSLAGQTLSNISIAVSGGITGSITLTNGDNAPHSTNSGTTSTNFSFGGLTGFTFANPIFNASFTSGIQPLAALQTLTIGGLASTPISTGSLGDNTTLFAPYIGAGNFTIPVSTNTLFSSSGQGGFFQSAQSSNANATAVVTFTYEPTVSPVPEPVTLSLLGMGFVGLGLLAHKFRK